MKVIECGPQDAGEWDDFVKRSDGTYCHLFGWKAVFERAYSLKTLYLAFHSGGEWAGVLPLAITPHLPGRPRKAISLPYCNYGGIVAAPGIDINTLRGSALRYLSQQGVCSVEFRDRSDECGGSGEVSLLLALPATSTDLWNQLGPKVRNLIRKAQTYDLSIRWGADQAHDLYDIYAVKMGELGTPVHSRRFIKEILLDLEGRADILTVRAQQKAIAAMLLIRFGQTWIDPFAASLPEFKAKNPNMLLYWEALRAACDAQAQTFDFGRSYRDSGTYRFKRQWGAQEVGLSYYSYCDGKLSRAAATDFYRGRSASVLAKVWRGLPLGIQRRLGPLLRRWIP